MAGSRLGSMKALYLEKISGNPERLQEKNSQTVMGAKVFEWNLLCALLEHGTYDAYLSPGVTEEGKRQLGEEGLSAGNVDRLSPAPLGSRRQAIDVSRRKSLFHQLTFSFF